MMNARKPWSAVSPPTMAAVKIAAIYLVFSTLWILFSDRLLFLLVKNPETLTQIQTIKGWFFVTTTALILFALLKREIHNSLKTESKYRESEEKYRSIFENAVEGFFQSTPEGRFIEVNPAFADMLGYDSPEDLVAAISDIANQYYMDPDDRRRYKTILQSQGFVENFEFQAKKKDGSPIWVSNSTRAFYDPDGTIVRYEGIVIDISERKHGEQERDKLQAQLIQSHKMEAVGTLAGGVAHDFNNLLSIILGNAELALEDLPEWSSAGRSISEIRKASLRAKEVVRQLLSVARKTDQTKRLIDLKALVTDDLPLLRSSLSADIDIRLEAPEEPVLVVVDPTRINQVMINLCINAAHAMPEGGVMEITLSREKQQDITSDDPTIGEPETWVRLAVRDTGYGIPETIMDRIFEPYFTTKEIGRGTGMGLAVVHGIIADHKGRIYVKSTEGKGTLVEILLPESSGSLVQEELEPSVVPVGKERILLIDDESAIAALGKQQLQRLGYLVEARTSPMEALEDFRADPGKFDLVITDLGMPEMSGYVLIREISAIRPEIKRILSTGYTDAVNRDKADEIGIHGFIAKPYDKRSLGRTVREVLDAQEKALTRNGE